MTAETNPKAIAKARQMEVHRLREELALAICRGGGLSLPASEYRPTGDTVAQSPEWAAEYVNRMATRLAVLLVDEAQAVPTLSAQDYYSLTEFGLPPKTPE